jgi:hypothetical protein
VSPKDPGQTYTAPEGTVVGTQVDPMGLETIIEFKAGKFTTTDPGLIAVLDQLSDNPDNPVTKG